MTPDRVRVGLCSDCRWARRVTSGRGALFFLCRRAETDAGYAKYPPLPRLVCAGYNPEPPPGSGDATTRNP